MKHANKNNSSKDIQSICNKINKKTPIAASILSSVIPIPPPHIPTNQKIIQEVGTNWNQHIVDHNKI